MLKSCYLVAIAFATLATAQAGQTTITLESVQGPVMGGVYTSPYYGLVGTNPGLVPIICDDFADESYLPENWNANVTALSGVTGTSPATDDTTLKFDTGTVAGAPPIVLNQEQAYTTAAYLAVEIMEANQSTPAGAEQAGDLSFALWGLFDPSVLSDQNGVTCSLAGGVGCLSLADYDAAVTDLQNAWSAVSAEGLTTANFVGSVANVQSVTIYSYAGNATCNGGPCPTAPPQEFISVTTPEASSPVLLAIDLLGFFALVGFLRKRVSLGF